MIVVLEGPDGAGKTTLAHRLRDDLGFDVRHEGPPPPGDAYAYYAARMYDALVACGSGQSAGVALDRFALGERVYGPLLRGHDALGEAGWEKLRGEMDALGVVRVLCLPPRNVCFDAWFKKRAGGGELIQRAAQWEQAYDLWCLLRNDTGQFVYDWTRDASNSQWRRLASRVLGTWRVLGT